LTIRKLRVVAEVNLLPKGLGSRTKLQRVGENLCANAASQIGCFVNNTYQNLAKCRTVFFAVLATTLSFLVRFRPVKYGIEALDILYTLVKGWSVRFLFLVWSMVRSNLGQTWSTLVKLGRTWSKLSKLLEMYPGLYFKGFWARWVLVGLETARSNLGQTLVNSSQTWSTLVKLGQTLGNVSRTFFLGVFDVMSPRRNRPTWFGLSRFACRHPRKSRG
jgi:hypothetical protein